MEHCTKNTIHIAIIVQLDKNITLLIIARQTTTLKNCDKTVELKDGKINNIWNSWVVNNE